MAQKKSHEDFILEMKRIHPDIKIIGNYVNARTHIECKCKIDGYEWRATPTHLLSGTGCPLCAKKRIDSSHKKKTHEKYIEECKTNNPNIEIVGIYTGVNNEIGCKCKICGGTFKRKAGRTKSGRGCPVCAGVYVCNGVNDIATTNPDIVKFFKNPNDAKMYTKGSNSYATFKCINCGYESENVVARVVNNGGFICPKCGDGISYPNKFSRAFLDQLNVKNVIYEYSPSWASPYRYDNYFEYNNEKYILEMDGAFHYIKYYNSNLPLEETIRIDEIKNELAKTNGVNIIRINCFYSTKQFIVKNIENSVLSKIFDLSKIDWDICDKKASSSLVKEVCDFYNKNPRIPIQKIKEVFNLNINTIYKYLRKGKKLGFCDYHSDNKIPIIVKIDNIEYEFPSVNDCIRNLSPIYTYINWRKFKTFTKNRKNKYENINISYINS